LRPRAGRRTMACVPRFLWLGLIACAALVLGALALVRLVHPEHETAPLTLAGPAEASPKEAGFLASSGGGGADRASIPASPVPGTAVVPGEPRGNPQVSRDSGYAGHLPPNRGNGVVEVRVLREEDDAPIAGARVRLVGESETDAHGVCVFTDLPELRVQATAVAPGRMQGEATAEITRDSMYATLEIRLAVRRDVVVRLLDPLGNPFRPEDWGLDRTASGRIGIVLANACGVPGRQFEAGDAPAHRSRAADSELGPFAWRLEIRGMGEACAHALLGDVIVGVETLDPRETDVLLRVDALAIDAALAPVTIRVLAADGDVPIEDALVEFDEASKAESKRRTAADGCVRIRFASSGITNAVVTARGFAPARLALARPYPPEFVARLVRGRRIEGRVVDQDGSPISGARVELPGAGPGVAASMRSAAGGVFRFHDLPSAEYRIHATYSAKSSAGGGQRVTANADCREGDVLGLEIRIPVAKAGAGTTPR